MYELTVCTLNVRVTSHHAVTIVVLLAVVHFAIGLECQ